MSAEMLSDPKLWVAASFAIFAVLFARLALPPIARALDGRAQRIKDELDEAARLRQEAEDTLKAYQQKQREVLAEAEEILRHAKQEAENLKQQAAKQLKESVERRVALANERIARAEQQAVQEVRDHLVDLSVSAARKIIEDHLTETDEDESIKRALSDLGRILH